MKFVLIFGPPAVGKMTVGMELEKITDLRLYHNHESIETIIKFFEFGSESFNKLIDMYRFGLFKEVANSDHPGMIFTYVWPFENGRDEHIEDIIKVFEDAGAEVCYVELLATLDERLKRNRTELRLSEKATKRDVEASEKRLLGNETKHQLNTKEGEFQRENYLRIENTELEAAEVADMIKKEFGL